MAGQIHRRAFRFAAERHLGQLYPGTDLPYLVHLGQVVLTLLPALAAQGDLDHDLALTCAVLHDTIEDTGTTREEILAGFGAPVASGVAALSKDPRLGREAAMADSLDRIVLEPREIWLVKLADRVANMDARAAHWTAEKHRAYAREARLILDRLGPASEILSLALAERIGAWQDP
jgi:(p)ppGpp synthase/HD superfamily hydrolase